MTRRHLHIALLIGAALIGGNGCSAINENPVQAEAVVPPPELTGILIISSCGFCHRPDSQVIPGGQQPYLRTPAEVAAHRERIGVRVADNTMPRRADDPFAEEPFAPLDDFTRDLILAWALAEP